MHTFYLPPGNLDLITVSGPDAVKLLQGQLTCGIDAVADPGSTRGALCNNKGRVLATFILVRHRAVFYLVMNKGLGNVLAATLKKYLPFYKCQFRLVPDDEVACMGVVGNTAALALTGLDALPSDAECRDVRDGWICTLDQKQQQYLVFGHALAGNTSNVAAGSPELWILTGMLSGIYPFVPDDVEKYTPQELHLDRHGFISFTKGCYTGQEIVARMHYRGKQKKMLFVIETPRTDADLSTETMEILDANGQRVGSTLKVLRDDRSLYGLVALPAEMEQMTPAVVRNAAGMQLSLRPF